MKLVVGIEPLNVPLLFARARRRIIMHAAVYGAFAASRAHGDALRAALSSPGFQALDVVVLDPARPDPWTDAFLRSLRFGISRQQTDDEVRTSYDFIAALAAEFPDVVRVHAARRLPCLPVLVVDNAIIFGQYAHAVLHAPQGFWGQAEADVERLLRWTQKGRPPADASAKDRACFRLINECVRAMCPAPKCEATCV